MKRIHLLIALAILTAAVFIVRLFVLQVADDRYKLLSDSNTRRENVIYPARGYIYDRRDSLIVSNQPAYNLTAIYSRMEPFDTLELCRLIRTDPEDLKQRLKKFKADVLSRRYSKFQPYPLVMQISREDYPAIRESLYRFPGFSITKSSMRDYVRKTGANIIGFLGEVDKTDFLKNNPEYRLGDNIGVSGVEKTYEKLLRGTPGIEYQQVNVAGRVTGPFARGEYDVKAIPGKNITLSIDADLQAYGERLLGGKRGSVVALEPSTGEILALVSSPTYDPSLLTGQKRNANYMALFRDPANILFDRALLAEYSPGSPFKLLTGLAALQMGAISADHFTWRCAGGYRIGNHIMGCHCGTSHPIHLIEAIERSCNSFFAAAYRASIEKEETPALGMDRWSRIIQSMGLGKYLDTDLYTGKKGSLPTSDLYDRIYGKGRWGASTTISNAIGQGEITITPMQLANMAAIIANKGFYYRPHILKAVEGKPNTDSLYTTPVQTLVDSVHFDPIIRGMRDVYLKGTARGYLHPTIEMCGKTGTVENFKIISGRRVQLPDHGTFLAFAPMDKPRIAIVVVVENGSWGSRWAAPIASLMMEKYLTGDVLNKYTEQRVLEGSLEDIYRRYDPPTDKPKE